MQHLLMLKKMKLFFLNSQPQGDKRWMGSLHQDSLASCPALRSPGNTGHSWSLALSKLHQRLWHRVLYLSQKLGNFSRCQLHGLARESQSFHLSQQQNNTTLFTQVILLTGDPTKRLLGTDFIFFNEFVCTIRMGLKFCEWHPCSQEKRGNALVPPL